MRKVGRKEPASARLFGSGHGSCLGAHSFLVLQSILAVDCVRLGLCRVLDVGFVEQILDAEQDLFDGDRRAPVLVLVEQRQANGARWIHVRVEQRRLEFALGRTRRVVVLEDHAQLVQTTFPWSLCGKNVRMKN